MIRNYQPQYSAIRYVGKDAELDVVIPAPDCTIQFSYHFILCKDRVVISKTSGPYHYMVGERLTTNIKKAVESFIRLDKVRYM